MDATSSPLPSRKTRLGFHYFPDTLHYRESDLAAWVPELRALGASWLVLPSSAGRAIPETFLTGMLKAGIEPVIQFNLPLASSPEPGEMQPILEAYARWGAKAVLLFDRPNARAAWPASGWAQQDLVERFLDRYLPLAGLTLKLGMVPVFPALEPGGNYWDTAFLRAALESLDRRKQSLLLQNLVLSAHAWTGRRSLNWGAGGPESWPETRPYLTPAGSQDQRGFRIYDWYQTIAVAVLRRTLPVLLLDAGMPGDPFIQPFEPLPADQHSELCLSAVRSLAGETVRDPMDGQTLLEPIPQQVLACNFWLLSAAPGSPFAGQAWYQGSEAGPAAKAVKAWITHPGQPPAAKNAAGLAGSKHPLAHYLLLPAGEWGPSDRDLDAARPFVKKYSPVVGFSVEEALLAERVTVGGDRQAFPDHILEMLRLAGCSVERIAGDGTSIAS